MADSSEKTLIQKIDDWLTLNQGIPLNDKVFFAENLRVMVHAGLSISEALNTLAMQSESKLFKKIVSSVRSDVESGRSLSQALAKFPKAFPSVFTNMVQIGEVSGTLEKVLEELSVQMRKDYELRSKVKGAMTYPIVILVAMLGITIGLVTFVLPKLLSVFKDFGDVKLPLATRVLMTVSDFVQARGAWAAAGAIAFVAVFIAFIRTRPGRSLLHLFIISGPTIGPIARKINLARFCRTVSGLLHTDIPIIQALTVTADVLGNVHYAAAARDVAERIKKGETIAQTLTRHPKLFPPLVVQMVMVGERSGTVDTMLGDVANFYERQVDQTLDNLSSVIEPILILTLGLMVGGIALAVITPIYSLTQSIAESN
jgi:type IV pilus assembly protein PilC